MSSIAAVLNITHNGRKITGRDDERPEWIGIRPWRKIMKHGLSQAGQHWHDTFLPLHFTRAAFRRYPDVYQKRSAAYLLRHHVDKPVGKDNKASAISQARSEHQPNVFTGTLRELSRHAKIKAFQTRVRVTIPTPSYIVKRPQQGQPNIVAELSAVNKQEIGVLSRIVQRTVNHALEEYSQNRTLPPAPASGS